MRVAKAGALRSKGLNQSSPLPEFLPEDECSYPFEIRLREPPGAASVGGGLVLADFRHPIRLDQFPLHGDVLFRPFPDRRHRRRNLQRATPVQTSARLRAAFVTPASFGTTARMPYPGRSNGERNSPRPRKLASFVQNG